MIDTENQEDINHFWMLQLFFWAGFLLIEFLSLCFSYQGRIAGFFAHSMLQTLTAVIMSFPLHIVFSILWESPLRLRVLLSIIAVLMVAAIWNLLRIATFVWFTPETDLWADFSSWYFGGIYVLLCWAALYHGIRYYQLLQSESVMKLEAEAVVSEEKFKRLYAETEAKEAQLKMLRYQLNPHFLFNTLNAINSLVGTDEPKRAQRMIVQLSQFLRYSLDNNPEAKIPLQREVEALSQYLEIEKTRFGERLRLEFSISDDVQQALIPSLLLQPLLENSMKHAIAKSETGGVISLSAGKSDTYLKLELSDSGPGITMQGSKLSSNDGRGIGLRNTIDRLRAFYDARFEFDLESSPSGGLKTVIMIPFETLE